MFMLICLRSQAMGLFFLAGRFGAAGAPWVSLWSAHIHEMLPYCLMGAMSIASALLCCLLRETVGTATRETVLDQ